MRARSDRLLDAGGDDAVEYRIVRAPDPGLIRQAVRMHQGALDRGILTALGGGFLRALYDELLRRDIAFLVAALRGDRLAGFILAATDARTMLPATLRAPHRFIPSVLRTAVRHPLTLLKILETLGYGGKTGERIHAELVVIAVDETLRSRGIGRRLVAMLDDEMRARGIDAYKVTVHRAMSDAARFYARNGFRPGTGFTMYGIEWDLFVRELGPERAEDDPRPGTV